MITNEHKRPKLARKAKPSRQRNANMQDNRQRVIDESELKLTGLGIHPSPGRPDRWNKSNSKERNKSLETHNQSLDLNVVRNSTQLIETVGGDSY